MRTASSGRRSDLSSGLGFGLPALLAAACGDNHTLPPAPDAPARSPIRSRCRSRAAPRAGYATCSTSPIPSAAC
jgi:hypothetical protein